MQIFRRLHRELIGQYRPKVNSAFGIFFWFGYRLLRAPECDGIEVLVHPEAGSEADKWLQTIRETVAEYLSERQKAGTSLAGVRLVIRDVTTHPVDTHSIAVRHNIRSFLRSVLEPACNEEILIPNPLEPTRTAVQSAVKRLDEVLVPWGFQFRLEKNDLGHQSFAAGSYHRGSTRIGLVWRGSTGLGCVIYEWTEEQQQGDLRERTSWTLSHENLLRRLGHEDDCHLVESGLSSKARNGGDPVAALVHDLQHYTAHVLANEGPALEAVMKQGSRCSEALG